jgi:hypothetical protein
MARRARWRRVRIVPVGAAKTEQGLLLDGEGAEGVEQAAVLVAARQAGAGGGGQLGDGRGGEVEALAVAAVHTSASEIRSP